MKPDKIGGPYPKLVLYLCHLKCPGDVEVYVVAQDYQLLGSAVLGKILKRGELVRTLQRFF